MSHLAFFTDYPRISAALMDEPWAIIPAQHRAIVQQLDAYLSAPVAMREAGATQAATRPLTEGQLNYVTTWDARSRMGIIQCRGIIGKGLSNMALECGGMDLNQIEDGLDQLASLNPVAVALHFNSPGGAVTGVQECAAAIDSFRTAVAPVFGYSDTMCASAAFWLATACDFFHASPTAIIGSIGVYSALVDSSLAAAAEGRKVHVITSGSQKARGFPGVPVTEEQLAAVRTSVGRMEARFFAQVQSRRPEVNPAEAFTGDYWPAQDAPAGLADGFIRSRREHLGFVLQTVAQVKRKP